MNFTELIVGCLIGFMLYLDFVSYSYILCVLVDFFCSSSTNFFGSSVGSCSSSCFGSLEECVSGRISSFYTIIEDDFSPSKTSSTFSSTISF